MNKLMKRDGLNKKGFTLVELIVVIAILGVLMVVLVPQYIQYVEKSRIGVDESMIGEVAHVMELTYAANESVAEYNVKGTTITVTVTDGAIAVTTPAATPPSTLASEVNAALAKEFTLTFPTATDNFKSKTYGPKDVVITMAEGKTTWTKLTQA
ncbi:MAG: prepilin-type N-terminal cleavage/methylation domain-containing protein [Oscillospiraceae bacterium]